MRTKDSAGAKGAGDVAFRYRTLLAARQILEEQYAQALQQPRKDQLSVERLRRLRTYVLNAIASLERSMEEGMPACREPDGLPRSTPPPRGDPTSGRERAQASDTAD